MTDIVKLMRNNNEQVLYDAVETVFKLDEIIDAQAAEIERLRDALLTISYIHDGNPSDAMCDVPEVDYARHMLGEARAVAREALKNE